MAKKIRYSFQQPITNESLLYYLLLLGLFTTYEAWSVNRKEEPKFSKEGGSL